MSLDRDAGRSFRRDRGIRADPLPAGRGSGYRLSRQRKTSVVQVFRLRLSRLRSVSSVRRRTRDVAMRREYQKCTRDVPARCTSRRHKMPICRHFRASPLTDSNRRPPPYHRATRREPRSRAGSRGHGSPARRRNRPKTSDLPWTPVPALVFPQGSLGYAGAGSPGRAISSVSAMVSLRPASVARMTSSAASEARARSMSSRPTGLSP